MIRSIDLLEATISAYGGKKGDVAKALGVANNTISNWLKRNHVSPQSAARCAQIIGENPDFAEALAGAETIEDESARTKAARAIHKAFDRSFRTARRALTLGRR